MDQKRKESLHCRQASATATPVPKGEPRSPKPAHIDPNTASSKHSAGQNQSPHYTVFIRLPFPRDNFQDPPPVEWDAAKDEALWKIISGSSGKDIHWEEISVRFQVSLPFLLQQAAWLYERRFESMKAQMKRLGAGVGSETASPAPAQSQVQGQAQGQVQGQGQGERNVVEGGVGMVRTGSRGTLKSKPRVEKSVADSHLDSQRQKPSAINTSKMPAAEGMSSPGTPRSNRPLYSRTPSTATVTQSRVFGSSPKPPSQVLYKAPGSSSLRRPRPGQTFESVQDDDEDMGLAHDGTSEDDSEEEPAATSRSQAFRRSQISKKPIMASLSSDGDVDDDDEDDDSGGYLPFAAASQSTKPDPAATLRSSPRKQAAIPQQLASKGKSKGSPPDSSTSSASSAQQQPSYNDPSNRHPPLNPRQRAELEKLSPRYKKSGSEGSPSMGSSFSDLDDASVTQSALDDAILSNMQHQSMGMTLGAGMGSRINGLRDALARK